MEIQSITNVVSIHKSKTSLTHLIDHSYCQAWSALLAAAILKMHLYFYIATDPTSCDVTIQDGGGVTRCNLKTALWKDTAREYNVLFTKQRSVPQIMPKNTTMVSLNQSSKVAMLITNRLSNTPARETQPSSPNTTGSCVIKVLIRRTSKLIGVSSDKPINTSVAQGDATCV